MSAAVLGRPAPEPSRTLRYGAGSEAVVDVFDPSGRVRATAMLLHGGFWRAAYDRVHLRVLAAALASRGVRVGLPEYRRVGQDGGGAPGTIDDAREIMRTVPDLLRAKPSQVVLAGHSAGGHLAMLAALEVPPRRVVSLAGVLDVRAAHHLGLSRGAVADFLGTAHPADAQIDAVDPLVLSVPSAEVVLIHGEDDEDVPVAFSERYAARDARIRLVSLPGAGHFDVIDPDSSAISAVAESIGR